MIKTQDDDDDANALWSSVGDSIGDASARQHLPPPSPLDCVIGTTPTDSTTILIATLI